jgi:hypothetical protein
LTNYHELKPVTQGQVSNSMNTQDLQQVQNHYERDGVALIRSFLQPEEVAAIRAELDRYILEDLADLPADARTFEKDDITVRNLWRLEKYNHFFQSLGEREDIRTLGRTPCARRAGARGSGDFQQACPRRLGCALSPG